jgi:hypothetical protein
LAFLSRAKTSRRALEDAGVEFILGQKRQGALVCGCGKDKRMTGDQSRLLKVGDRVCWGATTTDLGTVIETDWAGVSIKWDNGRTTSIQHNDMARVERVPVNLI